MRGTRGGPGRQHAGLPAQCAGRHAGAQQCRPRGACCLRAARSCCCRLCAGGNSNSAPHIHPSLGVGCYLYVLVVAYSVLAAPRMHRPLSLVDRCCKEASLPGNRAAEKELHPTVCLYESLAGFMSLHPSCFLLPNQRCIPEVRASLGRRCCRWRARLRTRWMTRSAGSGA